MLSATYITGPLRGIMSDQWCSENNGAKEGCKVTKGVCTPANSAVREHVKAMQRAVNAIRSENYESLIYVDGLIGPKTKEATTSVLKKVSGHEFGNVFTFCDNLMARVDEIAAFLTKFRIDAGFPAVADPTPPKPKPGKTTSVTATTHSAPKTRRPLTTGAKAAIGVGALLIGLGAVFAVSELRRD
jgi:hypothetical protein